MFRRLKVGGAAVAGIAIEIAAGLMFDTNQDLALGLFIFGIFALAVAGYAAYQDSKKPTTPAKPRDVPTRQQWKGLSEAEAGLARLVDLDVTWEHQHSDYAAIVDEIRLGKPVATGLCSKCQAPRMKEKASGEVHQDHH